MLLDLYLVRFSYFFLFVPCGRLSFSLHVKYTLSYRIVSSRSAYGIGRPSVTLVMNILHHLIA